MASERFDFAEFLAMLEAKRAALDTLIDSYRAALSLGALGPPGDVDVSAITAPGQKPAPLGSPPLELPKGAFLNQSLRAAIKMYLSAMRGKQTGKEITAALKEGGVESTSDNFESVVLAALASLKAKGEVLRFKDGWALAEFYPQHLRASLGTTKNANPKKAAARKRAAKPKGAKKTGPKAVVSTKAEAKTDQPGATAA